MADRGVKVLDQANGADWHLYAGDCCEVARGVPDDSLHYTIFSPPFSSLYTFSDDPRDVSNNQSDAVFWDHFKFLIDELYRATMPGRLVSIHCMNLPTSKIRNGYIGISDFRGDIIRGFQGAGFVFHSEVVVRKDPVSAMQRSKARGLLHKELCKDSTVSRMAIPDYVVTLGKPGQNPEPVAGRLETYYGDDLTDEEQTAHARGTFDSSKGRTFPDHKSIDIWQRYAEPVWMDVAQSDVLSHKCARSEEDERHIAPLQLTVIRRCVQLWTNPGDVVFSPFAGIGSELYVAVEMGRRGLGVELKRSYFEQAIVNLQSIKKAQADFFAEGSPLSEAEQRDNAERGYIQAIAAKRREAAE